MARRTRTNLLAALAFLLIGPLFGPNAVNAQSMGDYSAVPPFISDTVAPNILIFFDTSRSMPRSAHEGETFSTSATYGGLFEPTECYVYSSSRFQPDPAANSSGPADSCGSSYPWSGNLLNFAAMRRVDVAKWALIGGVCESGGRDSEDKCTTTLRGTTLETRDTRSQANKSDLSGRMPQAILDDTGLGATVYFLLPDASSLEGSFCVDNDTSYPGGSSCGDGDSFNEEREASEYVVAVDVATPSGGVIQDVGDKARLGISRFSTIDSDGATVIADIGSTTTDLVNTIEVLDTPGGVGTPLAEALYESVRYLAQISPAYNSGHYTTGDDTRDPYYFNAPEWTSV